MSIKHLREEIGGGCAGEGEGVWTVAWWRGDSLDAPSSLAAEPLFALY